jgi:hypothetical protein
MAYPIVEWAYKIENINPTEKITATEKAVLAYLSHRADRIGRCWPGVDTMSREMALSRRSIQSSLRRLEDNNLIRTQFRKNLTSYYYVLFPGIDKEEFRNAPGEEVGAPPAPTLFDGVQMATQVGANGDVSGRTTCTQTVKNIKEPLERAGRGTRLPDEFKLSDSDVKLAQDLGLNIRAVFDKFVDYWIAQPGQKGVKLDWSATWRNWCRNTKDRGQDLAPPDKNKAPRGTYN